MTSNLRLWLLGLLAGLQACQGGQPAGEAVPVRDLSAPALEASPTEPRNLVGYVDPRIGSLPPGFTNPGASVPHGLVSVGPDTEGPLNYGGYYFVNALLTGLSHIHMSAGVFQGGQVPVLPIRGNPQIQDLSDLGYPSPLPLYASPFENATEVTEPGYYRVRLLRYGVVAEVTASPRVALHRYIWDSVGQPPGLVLEPSRDLKGHHPASLILRPDGALSGWVQTPSPEHRVYFAVRAQTPFTLEDADGNTLPEGERLEGDKLLVVLRPQVTESWQIKVGLSYVDEDGALRNIDLEMSDWDFDAQRQRASQQWNIELNRIQVDGGRTDRLRSFYTALYRTLKFPNLLSDADGRYRIEDTVRQDRERPRYTQFSLWDTYRGHGALLAEIIPDRFTDMLLSLVEYAEIAGELPRWQLANRNPGYMSGDPAIFFIGEGWCRWLLAPEDAERAWRAMQATIEARPPDVNQGYWPVPQPGSPIDLVEGGSRNAGTTLEFGLADFALAAMAATREDRVARDSLLEDALRYRHLQDPDSGWIRPRDDQGDWITPFLPESGYGFQEGTSWQYSWLTMHDYAGLVAGMGGPAAVDQRLDQFFGFPLNLVPLLWPTIQNQITFFGVFYFGNQFAPGNEHDLQAPYVYNYIRQPWKTQVAARAAAGIYTDTPAGLPGNDDLGALSGWLVWTMLGLYPINPGLPYFTLGAPEFASATVVRPGGTLRIERGDDGYVNAASLNNRALDAPALVLPRGPSRLQLDTAPLPASQFTQPPASISTNPLERFGCTV